jgi:hypothetical protein
MCARVRCPGEFVVIGAEQERSDSENLKKLQSGQVYYKPPRRIHGSIAANARDLFG